MGSLPRAHTRTRAASRARYRRFCLKHDVVTSTRWEIPTQAVVRRGPVRAASSQLAAEQETLSLANTLLEPRLPSRASPYLKSSTPHNFANHVTTTYDTHQISGSESPASSEKQNTTLEPKTREAASPGLFRCYPAPVDRWDRAQGPLTGARSRLRPQVGAGVYARWKASLLNSCSLSCSLPGQVMGCSHSRPTRPSASISAGISAPAEGSKAASSAACWAGEVPVL